MADVGTVAGMMPRGAARTHPGRVRLNNEDLPLIDAAKGVFGVIDGIGGQAGGEVAAATAKDVILQRLARPVGTPVDRVREAIAIANNTKYGLAGAVWSSDVDRAMTVARHMRTGAVDINGAAFNPLAPFGGFKQSGFGRELGRHGLAEFLEVKAIQR